MSDDLNKLLKKYSPEVQDLAVQARELVLKTVPDAQEKVYFGWNGIHFSTSGGMQTTFCAISPQKARINLYFTQGVHLPDPSGLLEGTGKNMRHIKIDNLKLLKSRAVKALIKAAAKYQPAH
jgi:hypothetical protein